MLNSLKKYLAEFIGTAVLVLFACGTAAILGCDTYASYLATAIAFGLVIVAMAYSVGNISGCHINPAVSLAMLICKKLSFKDFVGYVIAQFAGATAGAGVLRILTGTPNRVGANSLFGDDKAVLVSIVIEVILTFVFVFTILGVTSKTENSSVAGLVIGGALTLVHLLGIAFTGTSVNPARSFGPALFGTAQNLKDLWVFIVAPLAGAALAAIIHLFFNCEKDNK